MPLRRSIVKLTRKALAIVFRVTMFYTLSLCVDHQPLLKILAPDSATPVLAAARLQSWSLLLSTYTYDIKFRNSRDIVKADALSRLPVPYSANGSSEDILFQVSDWQLDKLPVSSVNIARETATDTDTDTDTDTAKVLSLTQVRWPQAGVGDTALQLYFFRRNELSLERGFVKLGLRVITPSSLRNRLLDGLHDTHPGTARTKAYLAVIFDGPT